MAGVAMKIQQLMREIANCKQGDLTIEAYYATINALWDKLSPYQHIPTCHHCNGSQKHPLEEEEEERLHQFLMGVNDVVFGDARSALLSMDPLPSLDQAYSTLLRHEDDHNPILSLLPKEISDEILMRLPQKPLFALKSVSRRFKSAVMDPVFAQSYMNRTKFRGLLYPCIRLDYKQSAGCRPHKNPHANHYMRQQILTRHTDCREDKRSRILASSNGLILYQREPFICFCGMVLFNNTRIQLCVQNPQMSKQSVVLPVINLPARTTQWTCGFAARKVDWPYIVYNVVFMSWPTASSSCTTIMVYYSDTGSWVEVGNNIPCPKVVLDNSFLGPDFCYKGILHWIDGDNRAIVTYDSYSTSLDRFGKIAFPDNPDGSGKIMNVVRQQGQEEEFVTCCEVEAVCYGVNLTRTLLVWRLVDYDKGEWLPERRHLIDYWCLGGRLLEGCRQVIAQPGGGFSHVFADQTSVTEFHLHSGLRDYVLIDLPYWSFFCSVLPVDKIPLIPFVCSPWSVTKMLKSSTTTF